MYLIVTICTLLSSGIEECHDNWHNMYGATVFQCQMTAMSELALHYPNQPIKRWRCDNE